MADPLCPTECQLKTTVQYNRLPDCLQSNGSVTLSVAGNTNPLSYQWSDGVITANPTRNDLTATDYQIVIIEEDTECRDTCRFVISYPSPCPIPEECMLTLTIDEITSSSCDSTDGLVILSTSGQSGSVTFEWSDGLVTTNPIRSDLVAGIYAITATDDGLANCTAMIEEINLEEICCFTDDNTIINRPSCENNDGSVEFFINNATGTITFSWSDGLVTTNAKRDSLPEGNYEVIISDDETLCAITILITLLKPFDCLDAPCDNPNISADFTFDQPLCDRPNQLQFINTSSNEIDMIDSLFWSINGEIVGNMDTFNLDLINFTPDSFNVNLTIFSATCSVTKEETVIFEKIPIASRTVVACDNEMVRLNQFFDFPTNAIAWEANPLIEDLNNPIVMVGDTTIFMGRVMDNETCTDISLTINPAATPDFEDISDAFVCTETQEAILEVITDEAEVEILWSTTKDFSTILSEENELLNTVGTYFILIDNGCPVIDSATIDLKSVNVIIDPSGPFCSPTTLTLMTNNDNPEDILTYNWLPKAAIIPPTDTTSNPEINIVETTEFTVEISNQFGCETSQNIMITVNDTSQLSIIDLIADENILSSGQSTEINLNAPLPEGYVLEWEMNQTLMPNGTSATVNPEMTTTYTANLILENGPPTCMVQRNITVEVGCNSNSIFFPNAFSPNGDNRNDVLLVRGAEGYESMNLIIFNRWGEKVFESDSPAIGWDGRFDGERVNADVYGYYLTVNCPSDTFVKKGNVTVLK